ncbi:ADCY6 [Acanthosepion pharaonis]|uniref:ADCY6 n=1 Tax=Acanthosepion pharaonis TaxID=158019 RepID=A0A812D3P8_ACAPH|nr:ADCY6 [Sepia pharaonis]
MSRCPREYRKETEAECWNLSSAFFIFPSIRPYHAETCFLENRSTVAPKHFLLLTVASSKFIIPFLIFTFLMSFFFSYYFVSCWLTTSFFRFPIYRYFLLSLFSFFSFSNFFIVQSFLFISISICQIYMSFFLSFHILFYFFLAFHCFLCFLSVIIPPYFPIIVNEYLFFFHYLFLVLRFFNFFL